MAQVHWLNEMATSTPLDMDGAITSPRLECVTTPHSSEKTFRIGTKESVKQSQL
jgi:hypothetical protein